ncbi:hypothetical protein ANN_09283 [Periplaneta americana]|uniref:Uncharacterized protein n=1 Tax=Periplaneta americana TaxID=6978 RepID=A0ABQ8TKX3_PERAM|nr:hypothetical protein ANN_09283 [Periplaneta americana]
MSPGSNTESYPAFAHIGLRENPGKSLNQATCPDRESNPGHLVSRLDALTGRDTELAREGWKAWGKRWFPIHSPPALNDVSVARTQSHKNTYPLPYQVNDAGVEGRVISGDLGGHVMKHLSLTPARPIQRSDISVFSRTHRHDTTVHDVIRLLIPALYKNQSDSLMAADGYCHYFCKLMEPVRQRCSISDVIVEIRNIVMPSDCSALRFGIRSTFLYLPWRHIWRILCNSQKQDWSDEITMMRTVMFKSCE